MKIKSLIMVLLPTFLPMLVCHRAVAGHVSCHGTSILHFMEQAAMDGSGVESNAVGSITLKQNEQGHADNQRLAIKAASLQSNTTYDLFASVRSDTNLMEVATFTTDANGKVQLEYVKKNNGHGHGGGTTLPDALNPLSGILSLAVVNSATQTVLSVDLTAPDHLQYLIKRCLSNDAIETNATASLRIHATENFVQLRLEASGLTSNANYFLSINDTIETNAAADSHGSLKFDSLPSGAPAILDIDSLAIQNSTSNNVLSTTLP